MLPNQELGRNGPAPLLYGPRNNEGVYQDWTRDNRHGSMLTTTPVTTWGHQQNLACLRENPLRSLHWWDPVEQYLCQDDDWQDLDYDACVFGGARRKAQKFRRNIPELSSLPAVRCGRIHDPNEWRSGSSPPSTKRSTHLAWSSP